MVPLLEHVGAVADRVLAERVYIGVCAFGNRQERHVAHLVRERGVGCVERDLQRVVVHHLEAAQLCVFAAIGGLQRVIALDGREDRGAELPVRGVRGERPRFGVGVRGDFLAVGELQSVAQCDRVLRSVAVRGDRFGVGVDQLAIVRERDEPFEELCHDLPAGHVVGVAGQQVGGRLDVVHRDHRSGCGARRALRTGGAGAGAAAGQQHAERGDGSDRGGGVCGLAGKAGMEQDGTSNDGMNNGWMNRRAWHTCIQPNIVGPVCIGTSVLRGKRE